MNILLFHRDFRIEDNTALFELLKKTNNIYFIFIFTSIQMENNDYFSEKSFKFMVHCLKELSKRIKINFLKATSEKDAILYLLKAGYSIKRIYVNEDYTNYSIERSIYLKKLSKIYNFEYLEFLDNMLISPLSFLLKTKTNNYFKIFTPFWNKMISIFKTYNIKIKNISKFNALELKTELNINIFDFESSHFNLPSSAMQCYKAILNLDNNYKISRNYFYLNNTSLISASLKYGIISIRQAHLWGIEKFKNFNNSFNRQLMWRDFAYYSIYNARYFKNWKFGNNLNSNIKVDWINNKNYLKKWKEGKTGYHLVDAGMRELNKTGKMHNRARLICASFLTKNLHIDWRIGEKYFAKNLIDYDPIVNQFSWQWAAGTGLDAQPYFRIFNPEIQLKKFDKDLIYINKFLFKKDFNLPKIVDYKESIKKTYKIYSNLNKNNK